MSERTLGPGQHEQTRWEYAELRLYRRVTQVHFSHDQGPQLLAEWAGRVRAETLDSRRSTSRYVQLNRQEDAIDVLALLGEDGWELVSATSVQVTLRYTLKRPRTDTTAPWQVPRPEPS